MQIYSVFFCFFFFFLVFNGYIQVVSFIQRFNYAIHRAQDFTWTNNSSFLSFANRGTKSYESVGQNSLVTEITINTRRKRKIYIYIYRKSPFIIISFIRINKIIPKHCAESSTNLTILNFYNPNVACSGEQ